LELDKAPAEQLEVTVIVLLLHSLFLIIQSSICFDNEGYCGNFTLNGFFTEAF